MGKNEAGKRYYALRIIAVLISAIAAIFAAIFVAVLFGFPGIEGVAPAGVSYFVLSAPFLILAIIIYAFSELIYVRIDTEENTRKTYHAIIESLHK